MAAGWPSDSGGATLVTPSAPRKDASRRPAADTDPRLQLVEWNKEARALVFRGTAVPLSELWDALRSDGGLNTFFSNHPTVPVPLVRQVLDFAGRLLCDWPVSEKEKKAAYEAACAGRDPRFVLGAVKYHPDIKHGRLLCADASFIRINTIWDNLEGGATLTHLAEWFYVQPSTASKLIDAAETLFTRGLVASEDVPR